MTGRLTVIGLGPGPLRWLTLAAQEALAAATDIFGYEAYLDRLTARADQRFHPGGNREELERAEAALRCAERGGRAAIVSGGDPGIFAMAAAVFEAIERGPEKWRSLDISIEPGITAMLAAAARAGAPLGHDFCAISLSDNLKPWAVIEKRLRLACEADFVIALYNPASRSRPQGIFRAFEILQAGRPANTVTIFARAVGRSDERFEIVTLGAADPATADMQTLIIVGSSTTRLIVRGGDLQPWVYTPRAVEFS